MSHQQPSSSSTLKTALIAASTTAVFYGVAWVVRAGADPYLPGIADFVHRYFFSHPLEVVSTVMFFCGTAVLLQKALGLRSEKTVLLDFQAVTTEKLENADSGSDREDCLSAWYGQQEQEAYSTQLLRRIQDVLHYLKGSRRDGLEEHLRYLAELASNRLLETYAAIRTITWAIPILGFLGTVIGITMAIANVTPEQLDSSLGEVTRGLSVAFDTTALALGMSIILVFASFLVERSEQQVMGDVEQLGIELLLPWFGSGKDLSDPITEDVADHATQMASWQPDIWAEQLAGLRNTWGEVLQQHATDLRDTFDSELQQTLQLHRESSADARDSYSSALQQSTQVVVSQTERMMATFEDRVASWQQALQTSSQASTQQSEALHELGARLLRMTEAEERLAALQKQLVDNLHALQAVDTMEQTANSLAAAVHVLTAKTSLRSAA